MAGKLRVPTSEMEGLRIGGLDIAALPAESRRGSVASVVDELVVVEEAPNFSIAAGCRRRPNPSRATMAGQKREDQQQNPASSEQTPLISRGLADGDPPAAPPPRKLDG
jgi:hypothetical protein